MDPASVAIEGCGNSTSLDIPELDGFIIASRCKQ